MINPSTKHKTRLLIVVSYFPPYTSGLTLYAAQLALLLAEEYEVTVLTGRHDPRLPEEESVHGYRVIRAPLLLRLHKGYVSIAFIRQFIKLARESDVINLHAPMLEAGLLARVKSGKKMLLTFQCDPVRAKGVFDWLAVNLVKASVRVAALRSDKVVVLSRDYARLSKTLRGVARKIVELSPPCRFDSFQARPASAFQGNPSIGFVGRFVPEKGLPILLDVWSDIVEQFPQAKLFLAGNYKAVAGGSMFSEIETKIDRTPGIEVLGELSDTALWQLYSSIDVLVLPSLNAYEAFGMVQIEAMAAGAVVVASDLPGVRVPIVRTGNGVVVEPGSAIALQRGIQEALSLRFVKSRSEVREATERFFSTQTFRDGYTTMLAEMHPASMPRRSVGRIIKEEKVAAS